MGDTMFAVEADVESQTRLQTEGNGDIYYVSKQGCDLWSGHFPEPTPDGTDGPFATVQRAAELMKAGDTCYIRGGTYREMVRPARSGQPGNPITFTSYRDEEVILSGTEPLSGWEREEGSIYKASMPWDLGDQNQIFVGDQPMTEARWPNNEGDLLHPTMATIDEGGQQTITDRQLCGQDDRWKGATVWCAGGSEWICWAAKVQKFDSESSTLTLSPSGKHNQAGEFGKFYIPRKGNRYVLIGHREALDDEGEWWRDPLEDELHLWAPDGKDPEVLSVEAKKRTHLIDVSGRSYIDFSSLHLFSGAVASDSSTHHILLKDISGKYIGHSYRRDISQQASIMIDGSHNELRNCEFTWSSGSIILLRGSDHLVYNCRVFGGNYAGRWKGAVDLGGRRQHVVHNTFSDSGRDLVTVHNLKESIIEHNDLFNAGWLTSDLGIIYGHTNDFMNTVFRYNWIHDNRARSLQMGIYFDHLSQNAIIHHNAIWNVDGDPVRVNNPSYFMLIYNNTAWNTKEIRTFDHGDRNDLFGTLFVNNIFNREIILPEDVVEEHNLISEDPGFIEPCELSFQLDKDSDACASGVVLNGVNDDSLDSPPDIGAYERGKEPWDAGCNLQDPIQFEFIPTPAAHRNLVYNGAFELGSLEGWTEFEAGRASVVEGNGWGLEPACNTGTAEYELRIDSSGGVCQPLFVLGLQTTYLLSAWLKVAEDGGKAVIGIRSRSGDESYSRVSNSLEWKREVLAFTTKNSPSEYEIFISNVGQGPVYCDNIGLQEKWKS